jgi:signal peptidase I
MAETVETGSPSPWVTLWLSPRQTIERIVATQPSYMVLPLAIVGMIANFYVELVSFSLADAFDDWRLWLGLVLAGGIFGVLWLYLSSLILTLVGMLLGGEATARQLRAVIAWSMAPVVLGALVGVLALRASGPAVAASGALSWLAVVFGLWSAVVFMLMLSRVERFGFLRTILAWFFNLLLSLLVALLLSLPIRILLYHPFSIPSGAMMPMLERGDYLFGAKYPYGYSRFSLPFSPPLFSGRILAAEPQRGDVVVFRRPKDPMTDYISRVVGLPGDRIQMKEGLLYINDKPVTREPLTNYVGDACGSGSAAVKRWRETLPNGVSHEILDCVPNGFYDNTNVYAVPAGHYFMMGDNRDNATDSRVLSAVGYIPLENLVARADLIFYSRAAGENGAPATLRKERIGTVVR